MTVHELDMAIAVLKNLIAINLLVSIFIDNCQQNMTILMRNTYLNFN